MDDTSSVIFQEKLLSIMETDWTEGLQCLSWILLVELLVGVLSVPNIPTIGTRCWIIATVRWIVCRGPEASS